MPNRTAVVLGSALVTVLLLGGCASSHSTDESHSASAQATAAGINASDLNFVQMMIPHHQQAIEMSALAIDAGASPKVLDLAERIGTAQGPEIEQMRAMLKRWGIAVVDDHSGHSMPGMIDQETMQKLRESKGADFDILFLESMIQHHQGAIGMAQDPLANGSDPELRALLEEIVTGQSAEIEEMTKLLDSQN